MASIKEALAFDRSGYEPASPKPELKGQAFSQLEPVYNAMLRCPLPPVQVTPDSLRQFYLGGQVPQMRLLTPPSNITGSSIGGGTRITNNTIINNGGGSSSVSLAAKSVSVTTPVLNIGDIFTGQLIMAKSFQLLLVSASATCRVELYGTALAQTLDLSRGLDSPPGAGTFENIISDAVLDTTPFQLYFQNRIGANGDSPQASIIYVSITNIDAVSEPFTVTFQFVPLEQ